MILPAMHSVVNMTANGTRYLVQPGIAVLTVPRFEVEGLRGFLAGFDPELEFMQYMDDEWGDIPGGEAAVKVAGQLCYMSFGPKRTKNVDLGKYLTHIKESGHGSVLEHANYGVLLYGIDRAVTHEIVRHRVGLGISQVSQRYVTPATLRFVESPECATDPELHALFLADIDDAAAKFETRVQKMLQKQGQNLALLSGDSKTELRKKVQQAARRVLPNETEAPIYLTGNARTWRHITEMRAAEAADISIRDPFVRALQCLKQVAPMLFGDYEWKKAADGTTVAYTRFRKV